MFAPGVVTGTARNVKTKWLFLPSNDRFPHHLHTLRSKIVICAARPRRTGELVPFPYGDGRSGLPFRDGLAFETLVGPPA